MKFHFISWRFLNCLYLAFQIILFLSLFPPFEGIFYIGYFWTIMYVYSFHKYLLTVGCQMNVVG